LTNILLKKYCIFYVSHGVLYIFPLASPQVLLTPQDQKVATECKSLFVKFLILQIPDKNIHELCSSMSCKASRV